MAINLTKVLSQIQDRISDPATSDRDLNKLIASANRINNSGVQVLTYQSVSQLPSITDSAYIGTIARVTTDNIFGDSDGRYYYASGTDSGWRPFSTAQDSDEAAIAAPSGGAAGPDTVRLGETAGYVMSGVSAPGVQTSNQKFLFAAGTSAAGSVISGLTSLFSGRYLGASAQSPTHAYHSGGYGPPPAPSTKDAITKFPFATEGAFTDVGNMLAEKAYIAGGGTSSPTHGYIHGGFPAVNTIQKFSTSVDGNATDVGDLTSHQAASYAHGGAHSEDHGYVIGGWSVTGDDIQKYSFASDGNSTPVGNSTIGIAPVHLSYLGNNAQSTTHGYHVGGYLSSGPFVNVIAKFTFASDGNATDVGDLTQTKQDVTNHSATDGYIYVAGGAPPSPLGVNTIERFAYGSDGNGVDCGDLASATRYAGSAHV